MDYKGSSIGALLGKLVKTGSVSAKYFAREQHFLLSSQNKGHAIFMPSCTVIGYGWQSNGKKNRFSNIAQGALYELEKRKASRSDLMYVSSGRRNTHLGINRTRELLNGPINHYKRS